MIFEFKLETVTNRPIETATPVKIPNQGGERENTHCNKVCKFRINAHSEPEVVEKYVVLKSSLRIVLGRRYGKANQ